MSVPITHNGGFPERPRLRGSCRLFDDGAGVILRSSHYSHRIAPAHREAFLRVLAKLDGTRDFPALIGGEDIRDAFYAMRMIALLNYRGLIAEGPRDHQALPATPASALIRLDDVPLLLSVNGKISDALGRRLEALGAAITRGSVHTGETPAGVVIVSPDGPDLHLLEETNRLAHRTSFAWLPVFPFGDAIVTGPLIRPDASPCFRCFELRWLGISPSIALERAYLDRLRQGAWRDEALTDSDEAGQLADLVAPMVAACLVDQQAQITLIRPDPPSVSTALIERHPGCEVCADRTRTHSDSYSALEFANWLDPAAALGDLHGQVFKLTDSICGLASIVPPPNGLPQRMADSPQVVVARFAIPDPDEVDGDQDNWTHGSAATIEDAQTLAIIEAFERYNGLSQPSHALWASYASVADRATLPTELPLFSRRQYAQPDFPFQPFDPCRSMRWSWGYNLTGKKPVLVPTSAAWYGHDDTLLGETSSGVAAHSSRGHALLNGALEIIERDAFMIHWLHGLSPLLVDLDQLHGTPCPILVRQIEQGGYTVRLADLTTDLGIPVCLAIGFREDCQRPALLVGAGASLDPAGAAARALKELCAASLHQTDVWIPKAPLAPDRIIQLEDHRRAYEHPEWLSRASFLWTGSRRAQLRSLDAPSDPLDQLMTLIASLERHGHDLIGVDITAPDVAPLGVRVVRAIIPGLQPLGFGRRVRLGGRRLYEAPVRMGCCKAPVREDDLNMVPHCFP